MKIASQLLDLLLFVFLSLACSASNLHAQWVQTEGSEKQSVGAFAFKDSLIFAGAGGGALFPNDTTYYGGVLRSTDNGASWVQINNGLFSATSYSLGVYALAVKAPYIIAGTSNGIFRSSDNGNSWSQTNFNPNVGVVNCLLVKDSNIFAGTGRTPIIENFSEIYDSGGVFLSRDDGENWIPADSGLEIPPGPFRAPYLPIMSLAANGSTLYAGTTSGMSPYVPNPGIYRSTNNGAMWTYLGLQWSVSNIAFIGTIIFTESDNVGGVSWSTDNGNTWKGSNPGYMEGLVSVGSQLFAGCSVTGGVVLSIDSGKTWTHVDSGLTSLNSIGVGSLAVIGKYLFAGTTSGIWRRPLTEMITAVHSFSSAVPDKFILEQNYPNPFNPSTAIKYQLPIKSFVTLKVYNILGGELETLVNAYLPAGYYSARFNGSQYPSGIYFYNLSTNGYSVVKKMALIK